jgi:protein-tyrosine phosphatase
MNANEIIPGLWLGNRKASQDTHWLKEKNITVIFNATKDIPFAPGNRSMYRVPVDDNLEDEEIRNMEHWSWEIVFKVMKEYNAGKKILIHCYAGIQRSAAITAMVLIAKYRCSADTAIKYIKSKRPIAFYNQANFYKSIKGFEKSFFKMISDSNAYDSYPRLPLP